MSILKQSLYALAFLKSYLSDGDAILGFQSTYRTIAGFSAYLIVISTMLFGISIYLYYFISVNCQWSAWSWRGCSKSCGYGVQYGYRRKVRYARNGGRRCYGGTSTRRSCSIRRTCPRRGIINVLLYYHLI